MDWDGSPLSPRSGGGWEMRAYMPLEAGNLQSQTHDDEKNRRCRRCCGGFVLSRAKYGCLLASVCGLLTGLILIILIFAIVPAILRSQLNKSTLAFETMLIRGVPAEGRVNVESTVTIGNVISMAQAQLAEVPLTLSFVPMRNDSSLAAMQSGGAAEPFGTLTLPSLRLHGSTSIFLKEPLLISSEEAFERFTHAVLMARTLEMHVEGDISVTPKFGAVSLPTERGISYRKTVILAGCGGLRDIQVLSFSMRGSKAEELRCNATILINNPSPFGLHPIGQLQFDLYYDGFYQGSIHTADEETRMDPGLNTLNFSGTLAPDLQHLDATARMIGDYLTGRGAWVEARAAPNASSVPIYNRAMQGLSAPTFLTGLTNGTLISTLDLLSARMTPSLVDASVALDMHMRFTIDSPLGPEGVIDVHSMRISTATLSFVNTAEEDSPADDDDTLLPVGTVTMDASVPLVQVAPFVYEARMSAVLSVEHADNFQQFVRTFVQSAGQVGLNFNGVADVDAFYLYGALQVAGLPVINTLWMQGAAGLNETKEHSLRIYGNREVCGGSGDDDATGEPKLCGVLLEMEASMFNPSLLTLNLSNSWFDLHWNGVRMGSLQILPLFIAPGLNEGIHADGFLDPSPEDLPTVARFVSQYVKGVNHSMTLRGLTYDPTVPEADRARRVASGRPLTAHELVLGAVEAPAVCHGIVVESLLGDVSVDSFVFDFSGAGTGPAFALHTDSLVQGLVTLPPSLSIPLRLLSTSATLDVLFDVDGDGDLEALGTVTVPSFDVIYPSENSSTVLLPIKDAQFSVSAQQAETFKAFGQVIVSQPHVNATLSGLVNPVASTNMGDLALTDVPVRHEVSLIGYNGFKSLDGSGMSLVKVLHLDIAGATVDPSRATPGPYMGGGTILLRCNVTLMNPSQLAIVNLGTLEFDIWFQGLRIVTVSLTDFSFHAGLNSYSDNCLGTMHSPKLRSPDDAEGLAAMAVTQKFVSDYIDGFANDFTMLGRILQDDGTYRSGCSVPLLQPAFDNFATNLSVRGQPEPFIRALTVHLTIEAAAKIISEGGGVIPAVAQLYNPFGSSLTITHLNLTVLAGNLSAPVGGWLVREFGMQPIYVRPFETIESLPMPVYLLWQPAVIAALFEILFGPTHTAYVSAVGPMDVWIAANKPGQPDPRTVFNQTVYASQENVPAQLANTTLTLDGQPQAEADAQPQLTRAEAKAKVDAFIQQYRHQPQQTPQEMNAASSPSSSSPSTPPSAPSVRSRTHHRRAQHRT